MYFVPLVQCLPIPHCSPLAVTSWCLQVLKPSFSTISILLHDYLFTYGSFPPEHCVAKHPSHSGYWIKYDEYFNKWKCLFPNVTCELWEDLEIIIITATQRGVHWALWLPCHGDITGLYSNSQQTGCLLTLFYLRGRSEEPSKGLWYVVTVS